jgi:hypothetical protein
MNIGSTLPIRSRVVGRPTPGTTIRECIVAVSYEGTFVAETRRMVYPITYQWRLGGYDLNGSSGDVRIDGAPVYYWIEDGGRRCRLERESGRSMDAWLVVTATDTKGVQASDSRRIDVRGQLDLGGVTIGLVPHPWAYKMLGMERLEHMDAMIAWDRLPCTYPEVAISYSEAFQKGMGIDIGPEAFDFYGAPSEPVDWRPFKTEARETVYSTEADSGSRINALASLYEGGARSFPGVDLAGLDMSKLALDGIDARRANMATATLSYASLRGANLEGADLSGADLSGANLSEAKLGGARYDKATIWPEGVDPAELGAIPWG